MTFKEVGLNNYFVYHGRVLIKESATKARPIAIHLKKGESFPAKTRVALIGNLDDLQDYLRNPITRKVVLLSAA